MSTPTSAAGTQPPSSSADLPPELAGSDTPPPSARTTVRRASERGHYDAPTVHAIVDAAWLCHVAFTDTRGHTKGIEGSEPFAVTLPTACWRVGDMIYIHGSNGSPMMKRLAQRAVQGRVQAGVQRHGHDRERPHRQERSIAERDQAHAPSGGGRETIVEPAKHTGLYGSV